MRAMPRADPRISAFLRRCDALCASATWKRSTLSTKLFNDGKRLDQIADGGSDIGIGRLARAEAELATLEDVSS